MVNNNDNSAELSPGMAPDVNKIVPRPLPIQVNRVVDPAGPDRPWPKRTSAEVIATAERKAQLQEGLKQLNERAF